MLRKNWRKAVAVVALTFPATGLALPAVGQELAIVSESGDGNVDIADGTERTGVEPEGTGEGTEQTPDGTNNPEGTAAGTKEAAVQVEVTPNRNEQVDDEIVADSTKDPDGFGDDPQAGEVAGSLMESERVIGSSPLTVYDELDEVTALAQAAAATCELVGPPVTQYRNIILFIGDGMGPNQVANARQSPSQPLTMETLPVRGESITTNLLGAVTDSAAGATALSYGQSVVNSQIGVPEVASISEIALSYGKAVGVVTTDHTWGATPSAFALVHADNRNSEAEISAQELASGLNLIWGGASTSVTKQNTAANGFQYVATKAEWNTTTSATPSFGQFKNADLRNVQNNANTPSLSEMTEKAITQLAADPDGFFLMVEGAHIDKASHAADLAKTITNVRELDSAIASGLSYADAHPDTLIVVTADHETGGLTANGEYTAPGQHTGVNVPIFVNRTDAGFTDGCVSENQAIGRTLQQVLKPAVPTPPPAITTSDFTAIGAVTLTSPAGVLPGTGTVLTAKVDGFRPATGIEYTFEWFNGGKNAIQSLTTTGKTSTYLVSAADAGTAITVKVTASKVGYKAVTVASQSAVYIGKMLTAGTVTVTGPAGGAAQTGTKLTAKVEGFRPASGIAYTYEWFNGGKTPIHTTKASAAKTDTYILKDVDAGKVITVRVVAYQEGYQPEQVEPGSGFAVDKLLTSIGTVALSAPAGVSVTAGTLVTARVDGFRPVTGIEYSYEWYRSTTNGKRTHIQTTGAKTAKTDTYRLTAQDANKEITVVVTAKRQGYQPATVTATLK